MTQADVGAARAERIRKRASDWRVTPNLADYDQACRTFTWAAARAALDGLPGGRGLNIAHEAVDRHAAGAAAGRVALRFISTEGSTRDVTYADLRIETNRFANVLKNLGVGRGDPVAVLANRVALFVKAVALALHDSPDLNGFWVDNGFRPGPGVHVGCAVALRGGGLVAPAIHDTDRKDLATVMRDLRDVTARVRAGTMRSSELTDATITVTNLGDQGADAVHGIIYPPQVALVGFGRVVCRPWVVSNRVEVRQTVTVTLAADHRASDGHRGGLLLAAIKRRLQLPSTL